MDYRKNNSKNEYLRQSVLTAGPAELVVMLFDGCIKNLKLAEICLRERGDIDGANAHFIKAQKIVMELVNCLDTSFQLSEQLMKVYDYLLFAIRGMNARKDLSLLPDVLEILTAFRDTWEKVRYGSCNPAAQVC